MTDKGQTRIQRLTIAGCPVDRLSFDEAAEEVSYRIANGIKSHVVFINAAKIVKYHQDPALRSAIERADLLLADGVPVVWASRLLRRSLPGRVNGTDLMERMIEMSAERGFRLYFLGAQEGVLVRAIGEIQRRYPAVQIAGFRNGYFQSEDQDVVTSVNSSGADLLFVGMSTPQKELWVEKSLSKLNVTVAQGVGGSLDVIAGVVSRAPRWMQRSGLEWFYRFLQEPGRMWRRYLVTNSTFLWLVLCEYLQVPLPSLDQRY